MHTFTDADIRVIVKHSSMKDPYLYKFNHTIQFASNQILRYSSSPSVKSIDYIIGTTLAFCGSTTKQKSNRKRNSKLSLHVLVVMENESARFKLCPRSSTIWNNPYRVRDEEDDV